MGMDVFGNKNDAYFRRNVWHWRPLADCILDLCLYEASPCRSWHSNDGEGLNAAQSLKLADALQRKLGSTEVKQYFELRDELIGKLPDESCECCGGTGVRTDAIGLVNGMDKKVADAFDADGRPNPRAGQVGSCNACGGHGLRRPPEAWYHADVDDVVEFVAFLRICGGFRIC